MTDEQYKAAIRRNLSEINWAKSQRLALLEISKTGYRLFGDEFLGQCMVALSNDMFSHLIKVLDTNQGSASFWFIHSTYCEKVNGLFTKFGIPIDIVHTMTSKLRLIRNKTHFHIDKNAVIDPEQIWKSANITGDEIDEIIRVLDIFFTELFKREISKLLPFYGYEGQNTKILFDFALEKGLIQG